MQLGLVVGTARATVKHSTLQGWKLLVVQPLMTDGESADGDPQLVIDTFGASRGDRIVMTSDGKGTTELMKSKQAPVRWSVMGIADR